MKKALAILACLALVAVASAELRIFFTKGLPTGGVPGLDNPANAFKPSTAYIENDYDEPPDHEDNLDYSSEDFVVTNFPTYGVHGGGAAIPTINPELGEFVYIWFQMHGEPSGANLMQLEVNVAPYGLPPDPNIGMPNPPPWPVADAAWYRCDDRGGVGTLRWDTGGNYGPSYPYTYWPLKENKALLTRVTATGISNVSGSLPANLYRGGVSNGTTNRIALLGAVKPYPEYGAGKTYTGYLGWFLGDALCIFNMTPRPDTIFGRFHVIPEPASLLLIGLGSLLIRRR